MFFDYTTIIESNQSNPSNPSNRCILKRKRMNESQPSCGGANKLKDTSIMACMIPSDTIGGGWEGLFGFIWVD